jgi:hypothetical protein
VQVGERRISPEHYGLVGMHIGDTMVINDAEQFSLIDAVHCL